MLFNYRYVQHSIETFQTWLAHLVKEVWCRHGGAYSIDLLHEDLRAVILEIYNTEEETPRGNTSDYLFGPIKRIDALFQEALTAPQRNQIRDWFDYNNDIEALCAGNPVVSPVSYSHISSLNTELAAELKTFCQNLFTNVIGLKAVTRRIGEIEDHYKAFTIENDEAKCPYCGFGGIKGQYHTKREAYDHFLPKNTYPFNTVNFKNLAPLCYECNSSYKLAKDITKQLDPINGKPHGVRRKAFYSYATIPSGISISIHLLTTNIEKLHPSEIDIRIAAPDRDEEAESWKDVFGIEERYKAKCCAANDGVAWRNRVLDEHQNYGLTRQQMLDAELSYAERKPWTDSNFLKKPFLLACQKAGII